MYNIYCVKVFGVFSCSMRVHTIKLSNQKTTHKTHHQLPLQVFFSFLIKAFVPRHVIDDFVEFFGRESKLLPSFRAITQIFLKKVLSFIFKLFAYPTLLLFLLFAFQTLLLFLLFRSSHCLSHFTTKIVRLLSPKF